METNLKAILKSIKLNESSISTILGILVIIVVGILVVNYFKGQEKGNILTTSSTENVLNQTPALTGETGASTSSNSHTVVKGDTLWSIAEKAYGNGSNWTKIASANKIANPNKLLVGQKLTLPVNQVAQVEPTTTTKVSQTPSTTVTQQNALGGQITAATYTVKRGDNLWNISVRAYGSGLKWHNVASANKLVNPRLIHAGNILILPR